MSKEIWKDIVGLEGYYQVSNIGRVKRLSRTITGKNGCDYNLEESILSPTIEGKNKSGYLQVHMSVNNKQYVERVHKLVAESFLGYIPNGHKGKVVDHIDENKLNNNLSNLRLISHRKNISRSRKQQSGFTGVVKIKESKYYAFITHNYKTIYLGTFKTKKEAYRYYCDAVISIENGEQIKKKRHKWSSKYDGVGFYKPYNKWQSYIKLDTGKIKHLGYFNTEYDAHLAYQKALNEI